MTIAFKHNPIIVIIVCSHISAVLRREEKLFMYLAMFDLWQERAHYRVEVTGLSIHRGLRKEFIVLNVKLDEIAEIRIKLNLSNDAQFKSWHRTIGERFVN